MTQEYSIKHEKKSSNTSTNSILELPENKKVILLSAIYSGEDQKVFLKFYDPELKLIYFWKKALTKPIGLSIDPGDRLSYQILAAPFKEKGKIWYDNLSPGSIDSPIIPQLQQEFFS